MGTDNIHFHDIKENFSRMHLNILKEKETQGKFYS